MIKLIKENFNKKPLKEVSPHVDNDTHDADYIDYENGETENDYEEKSINYEIEKELGTTWWTRLSDLVSDLESIGFEVLDSNIECVQVARNGRSYALYLAGTTNTIYIRNAEDTGEYN